MLGLRSSESPLPELPEVAILARDLSRITSHARLKSVYFRTGHKHLAKIFPASAQRALRSLINHQTAISSSGKLLVIRAGPTVVSIQLGMTGQFRLAPVPSEYRQHHFMSLTWDTVECCFLDFRRFARAKPLPPSNLEALGGFDPKTGFRLQSPITIARQIPKLQGFLSTPRIRWLLRHGHRTGIGNYLANEALGRLALSPFEPCRDAREAMKILGMCQRLAKLSYRAGGTSFGIGYFRLDGSEGTFSKQLAFYKNPRANRTLFHNRAVYSNFSANRIQGPTRAKPQLA
jgi:formamidopyrimidine-DNA glycosylase